MVNAAALALKGPEFAQQLKFEALDGAHHCASCGQAVRALELDDASIQDLLRETASLAPVLTPEKKKHWDQFLVWETENVDKYDCVVDGANISFFRTQSPNSNHDEPLYSNVDRIMEMLISMGRKPLLFFHARHFRLHGGIPRDMEKRWKPQTFVVPHGHNDDVFWLHFSLLLSTKPRGVWLITNDQMRDHKFEMINQGGAFAMWKERHQVGYDLIWDPKAQKLLFDVYPPLEYSVQAQFCKETNKWHFPRQLPLEPEEEKRRDTVQRLLGLSQPDLRREWGSKKISFELYREVRAILSGCTFPKRGKFVWTCV